MVSKDYNETRCLQILTKDQSSPKTSGPNKAPAMAEGIKYKYSPEYKENTEECPYKVTKR